MSALTMPRSDEEWFRPILLKNQRDGETFTWGDLTAAGDHLHAVRTDDDDGWILAAKNPRDLHNSDEEAAACALINFVKNIPLKKITDADVDKFPLLVCKARQESKLHQLYLRNPDFLIQHDSSVDSVVEKIPIEEQFYLIPESKVRSMVEELISIAKGWYEDYLYYQLRLSLPHLLPCLQRATSTCDAVKMLKEADDFDVTKYGHIEDYLLIHALDHYFEFLLGRDLEGKEIAMRNYLYLVEFEFEDATNVYLEMRQTFGYGPSSSVQFLLDQEIKEGYRIQDPVVEIAKLSACLLPFDMDSDIARSCMLHEEESSSFWDLLSRGLPFVSETC